MNSILYIDDNGKAELYDGDYNITIFCKDEQEQQRLDEKLNRLRGCAKERPMVCITHFVPDGRKQGGAYVTEQVCVRRVDAYARTVCITGGGKVVLPSSLGILTGTFSSSARGDYGFVTSDEKEYFVPPRFTAGAKNGDTVAIKKIDIRSKYAGKGKNANFI